MDKGQVISYATIAMQKLGYNQLEIEKVTNEMIFQMDQYTREQADNLAIDIIYGDS
jgi:hypothetical protein